MIQVKKRNGDVVDFDIKKIENAVLKAFKATNVDAASYPQEVAKKVKTYLENHKCKDVEIEEIQDLVEHYLVDVAYTVPEVKSVMKRYILYRDRRNKDRESVNKLSGIFSDIINISDNDTKKSNANIDGNTPSGQMYIFGSESSKDHACKFIINPKYIKAYEDGFIHIHDLDYVSMKAVNCNQNDIVSLFRHDYIITNDVIMRKPKRISSFASLAAITLQSTQNEFFGGQSIPNFEYGMAEGVRLTFKELFKKYYNLYLEIVGNMVLFKAPKDEEIYIANKKLREKYTWIYDKALSDTIHETHEAMAAFVYNLNSMHSRAGNQIVFSSINYGTDTTPEGRIVIDQTLNVINEGAGDGSTFIFPISVFKVKDGINYSKEDWELARKNWDAAMAGKLKFKTPNFDLYLKSLKVSSRRLFPNYVFLDATYNRNEKWRADDPEKWRYEIATMGCRTRVYSDINGEKTCISRGNLSFTTINLPMLALEAMKKEKENVDARIKYFFDLLTYYVQMTHDQLKERYEWQCSAYAKQFPFLVKNNMVMGMNTITPENYYNAKIGHEILKHGTLGIGYIGLAETLKALIGKHHGESEEAQKLGLKIIKYIREQCDEYTETEKLNYGCFASPAESYCGKALKKARAKYGIVPGVTDRDYFTNSNHCPVYYPISAIDKIKLEAPYHDLANSGNISYVELDGDAKSNIKAFASVVAAMHDNNIGYGSVNHNADRCDKCGYEGPIKDKCPICENTDENLITRIRRITGYLTGDSKTRWNSAKQKELHDRVKHI